LLRGIIDERDWRRRRAAHRDHFEAGCTSNHGEGNPEAADRFNTEREFVGSVRGKKKIQEGVGVRPEEEADLARSEQLGQERAKGDDPI
jgi:hypothetical protein